MHPIRPIPLKNIFLSILRIYKIKNIHLYFKYFQIFLTILKIYKIKNIYLCSKYNQIYYLHTFFTHI